MKLNNKGFAISTVMYMILIMAVVLITLTLSILSARKLILDKIRKETTNNIYNVYDITYRQALEILKEEALTYKNNNTMTSNSVKISDINSSIDQEILDGYNLSEKYLTINNDTVYLGKSTTITNIDTNLNKFIDIVDYKIYGNSIQNGTPTPDNPIEIESVGELVTDSSDANYGKYKIPVSVSGKNLLNIPSDFEFTRVVGENELYLEPGTYTLSIGGYTSTNNIKKSNFRLHFEDSTYKWYAFGENTPTIKITTTKKVVGYYIYAYTDSPGSKGITVNIKNLMLEEGDTATDYEPYVEPITTNIYLDEPLRCIENNCDYIDFKNGTVVRNNHEGVFFGTETWSGGSTATNNWGGVNTVGFYKYSDGSQEPPIFNGIYVKRTSPTLNNYFSYYRYGQYNNEVVAAGNASNYYSMRIGKDILSQYGSDNSTDAANITAFNAWLKDKYDSGNPVRVLYQLRDPYEETISLSGIDYGEYTNISVDTSLRPSNVEFNVIEKILEIN